MKSLFSLFMAKSPAPPVKEKAVAAGPVTAEPEAKATIDHTTLVLIAAALAASGHSRSRIVAIHTLQNQVWTQAGWVETVQNRSRISCKPG